MAYDYSSMDSSETLTAGGIADGEDGKHYLTLSKLRRQRQDFATLKNEELLESRNANKYYHGDQWTKDELRILAKRRQPVVTYNYVKKKINAVVGLLERLRQDPKAFPRGPGDQEGATLSTQIIRAVMDENSWRDLSSDVGRNAAVRNVAGVEFAIVDGDQEDPDVSIEEVDSNEVFYDPRSKKRDFRDARYLGIAKWLDEDEALDLFPEYTDTIKDLVSTGGAVTDGVDLPTAEEDSKAWVSTSQRKLFLVEHWYKCRGEWMFCFYTGSQKFYEGISPFRDHKGRTMHRFELLSAEVDDDNDRYGLVRDLTGPQDEINHRRSKGLHALNTRQVKVTKGTVQDIDDLRSEIMRPDGVIQAPAGAEIEIAENTTLVTGNLEMMREAMSVMDNFGPNPALVGQAASGSSGRAIQLLQQAGIAELGPFIIAYRGWKLRVYRKIWNLVLQNWKSQRWIRVMGDDGEETMMAINASFDEHGNPIYNDYGQPAMVNAIGNINVEIILDEGPDTVTLMEDVLQVIQAYMDRGVMVPPELVFELMNLPVAVKQRIISSLTQAQQPNPLQLQDAQLQMEKTAQEARKLSAQSMEIMSKVEVNRETASKTKAQTQETQAKTLSGLVPPQQTELGPVERALQ